MPDNVLFILQKPVGTHVDIGRMGDLKYHLFKSLKSLAAVRGKAREGPGIYNIFIDTSEPEVVFAALRKLIPEPKFWKTAKVAWIAPAWHAQNDEDFIVLWPPAETRFSLYPNGGAPPPDPCSRN